MPRIMHQGRERGYEFFAPEGGGAKPLVFVFHGSRGTGALIRRIARFDAAAAEHGLCVCYPDGVERHWNDGRDLPQRTAHGEQVDDVGFIQALLEELGKREDIDAQHVFAAGASNGAMLCYRLAVEASDSFAGMAAVMCPLHRPYMDTHRPPRPMPLMMIHGTADPICPYDGGPVELQGQRIGEIHSFDDSVARWAEWNGCQAPGKESLAPGPEAPAGAAEGELHATGRTYPGPAPVEAYTIHGGGHTWPGGEQYAPESLIGKTLRDWSASAAIAAFFAGIAADRA